MSSVMMYGKVSCYAEIWNGAPSEEIACAQGSLIS
jgi:hypothetical protein